jgi:hypothetical protein
MSVSVKKIILLSVSIGFLLSLGVQMKPGKNYINQ